MDCSVLVFHVGGVMVESEDEFVWDDDVKFCLATILASAFEPEDLPEDMVYKAERQPVLDAERYTVTCSFTSNNGEDVFVGFTFDTGRGQLRAVADEEGALSFESDPATYSYPELGKHTLAEEYYEFDFDAGKWVQESR